MSRLMIPRPPKPARTLSPAAQARATELEQLAQRIKAEREAMNLAPWQFAPSEVQDEPCPYPPGSVGFDSWAVAAEQWQALKKPAAGLQDGAATTPSPAS